MKDSFAIRNKVDSMAPAEVLMIMDIKKQEYIWTGEQLYRLLPLKGRFGRFKKPLADTLTKQGK